MVQEKNKKKLKQSLEVLMNIDEFKYFIECFIKDDIIYLSLNEDVGEKGARDEIMARQILSKYIQECLDEE